jgi:hypothetical protein
LPLVLKNETSQVKIFPTQQWKKLAVSDASRTLLSKASIEKMYYVDVAFVPANEARVSRK